MTLPEPPYRPDTVERKPPKRPGRLAVLVTSLALGVALGGIGGFLGGTFIGGEEPQTVAEAIVAKAPCGFGMVTGVDEGNRVTMFNPQGPAVVTEAELKRQLKEIDAIPGIQDVTEARHGKYVVVTWFRCETEKAPQ